MISLRVALVAIVLLLAVIFGARLYAATPDESFKQGEMLLNKQDYSGAIRAVDASINGRANNAEAYCDRGLAYLKLHQYQKAVDDCSTAMQLDSNNAQAHFFRAQAYLELHDYTKAIHECTDTIFSHPNQSADVLITRARAYSGLGQSRKAMEDLEAARKLAHELQPTYHVRATEAIGDPLRRREQNNTGRLIANPEDFGGIKCGFMLGGESGYKTVGFGNQFYVIGEKNESLFKSKGGGTSQPSSKWVEWRVNLARLMVKNWIDTSPGQGQALITITQNGRTSIEWLSYVPGVSKEDKTATSPQSQQLFERSAEKVVSDLNGSKTLSFPAGATATEVVALAHFVSDLNMYIDLDDLSVFEGLPQTDKDVRISRICTILDAQRLYDLSDHFRRQLPPKLQHHFCESNRAHFVLATWPELGAGCMGSLLRVKLIPLRPDCVNYIKEFLDNCISTNQYTKAEAAARWVIWASHTDTVFDMIKNQATTKADALDAESHKIGTVAKLRTSFNRIDSDMQRPKPKARPVSQLLQHPLVAEQE